MVPPSGTLHLGETVLDAIASSATLAHRSYALDACSEIARSGSRYGGYTGVPLSLEPCGGAVALRVTLDTPWDNVVEIKRETSNMRGLALAGIFLSTLSFGLPGGILYGTTLGESSGAPCTNVQRIIGGSFFVVRLLVDLLFLPTILVPDHTTTAYPRTER
jgi:hypothetical protein